uniref:beta-N-acetylhexosaminidase n=1 Tax=Cacopsylla melanoneura TaxID=428564 RepID=A0A8D9A6A9_9HEMI
MSAVSSSPGPRFFVTIRRKKSALLGVTLVTAAVLLCLQYNVAKDAVDESVQPVPANLYLDTDKRTQEGRPEPKPVQFIANSIASDFLPEQQSQFINNYPQQQPYVQSRQSQQVYPSSRKQIYVPPQRIVHFDLKGAPPKVSYLKHVFALIKKLGATGVLLEWEDMFPWRGPIKELAASNAYSKEDIKEILASAKDNSLAVIPLIQTFGHMEFALKYNTFSSLREVPESAQALCPSLNDSLTLVEHMVEQVIALHGHVPYLHVGCDEVFQMGECPRCRPKPREDLFLSHVANVARIVKKQSPHTIPLIWDDMLRHLPAATMMLYKMNTLVEPMVWVYAEDIYRFVPSNVWDKYASVFPYIWTASAFKGAFGETMYVPNVKRHLENNLNWLELMSNEGPLYKGGFRGIAITGWQRYDHFATLCELLPAAIPSLAVNTLATSRGFFNATLLEPLVSGLECSIMPPSSVPIMSDPFLWDTLGRCGFPGHGFFNFLQRFNSLQREVADFITQIDHKRSWLTQYNVRHNFSSPLRVDELLMDAPRLYHTATSMVHSAIENLQGVYDNYTVAEWIEQNIWPLIQRLDKIQQDGANLKQRKVWPRRPFPIIKELERFGLIKGEPSSNARNPGLTANRVPGG